MRAVREAQHCHCVLPSAKSDLVGESRDRKITFDLRFSRSVETTGSANPQSNIAPGVARGAVAASAANMSVPSTIGILSHIPPVGYMI